MTKGGFGDADGNCTTKAYLFGAMRSSFVVDMVASDPTRAELGFTGAKMVMRGGGGCNASWLQRWILNTYLDTKGWMPS